MNYLANLELLVGSDVVVVYGGKARFFEASFGLKITIKRNHFMYLQAYLY
jgi:hypothetical protein